MRCTHVCTGRCTTCAQKGFSLPRNRSWPPHLEIRRLGFYWRRRLSRSLLGPNEDLERDPGQGACPGPRKMFLCFSLRTHVLRDAKILARRLTEMSDLVFDADAEKMMSIAPETQVQILESLARFEIEAFERIRAHAGPRSPEAAALDLRREEALQATLRQALYLGDREVVRRPLQYVAAQLGLALDDSDVDWTALAYEATKVLLDVSQERERRQRGLYDQPSIYFRRALGVSDTRTTAPAFHAPMADVAPASLACLHPRPALPPSEPITPLVQEMTMTTLPTPASVATPDVEDALKSEIDVIVPAGLDMPAGFNDESWQKARISTRPPCILVDRTLLSDKVRAALAKERGITLSEAIELFFELRSWGYNAPFNIHQKRKEIPERLKKASVEERLCQDLRGKRRLALDYWPAVLDDIPVDEIHVDDVNDALERFWRVPANHGKSERDRGKFNLVELIEKADAKQAQLDNEIAIAKACGANAETIDKMILEGNEPRLAVSTYVKHGRIMRAVGEMLMEMQLIDQNPFSICSWTNKDLKMLKSDEGGRKRQAWDDRIYHLFGSRIFHEPLQDIGDPLFWAPLIARHQGMRMEEILQLGPEDFGTDKGIPYLEVRQTIINGVKTLSSERRLPIHPQLIELGLLKLVELRKKEGHIRLFPFLNRGKQKGTFSANFSKCFGYYRRTNDCYWPGLDFHALRTTFHHELLGDDKSDAIRCRLMGHSYTDEGDRSYGQNLSLSVLAERMKSVIVDISMVRYPFGDPFAAVQARAREHGLRIVG